jgi:signal transduction histidine kinase
MRKSIWIFLLAVLLPSVVLGWLALRSAEEQKIILERRTAELYQKEADNVAAAARTMIDEQRRNFADIVRKLIAGEELSVVAANFTKSLAQFWPRKAVGFAIGADGRLLSPTLPGAAESPQLKKFLLENSAFLGGNLAATVYPVPVEELVRPEQMRKQSKGGYYNNESQVQEQAASGAAQKRSVADQKQVVQLKDALDAKREALQGKNALAKAEVIEPARPSATEADKQLPDVRMQSVEPNAVIQRPTPEPSAPLANAPAPTGRARPAPDANIQAPAAAQFPIDSSKQTEPEVTRRESSARNVLPQQTFDAKERAQVSTLWSATTEFKVLCENRDEGMVTRFVQDRLDMIFWLRPAQAPEMIFGCLVEADSLADLWSSAMPDSENGHANSSDFILALLDDKARPVITHPASPPERDWKRPFVASEIGEALPHWEAALYLMRPEQLQESARTWQRTLLFLIVGMLGAIACGGWLVVHDARLQLARAQQKTDFVSNVSHELKTPLTSIRMFAELMQNGRAENTGKMQQYLRIIMVEAERLTRLINNVLDFAKLERRQKSFDKKPLDLHAVIQQIWETQELHLRDSGFTTRWQAAAPPYPVIGDEDALAQILVNLLSNAEKYAGANKEVELHSYLDGDHVCVSVLDRGSGVPAGEERKIFEAFYRAHDSLSSGIQGSGLGLTLAQRLAREHGGEVVYCAREGAGSSFTLRLPLARRVEPSTLNS